MKLKTTVFALASLVMLPFAAMAVTVERSSAPLAGVSGWSPVLIITDGASRSVVGLAGVAYAVPIATTIPVNTLMYERNAVAWVEANYGPVVQAFGSNGGGTTLNAFGDEVQGGGSW